MLSLELHKVGKKFGSEWIFRRIDLKLAGGESLVILGGNGSGKSTLLQLISGFVTPSEGDIAYTDHSGQRTARGDEHLHRLISFASPYLQLIEDLTLEELTQHLSKFRTFRTGIGARDVIGISDLSHARHKYIRQFSSGMKQRLKLALAILSDTPLLLLDEPVSNLDRNATLWYRNMIESHGASRTIIVCSNNIEEEYFFCGRQLDVTQYKS